MYPFTFIAHFTECFIAIVLRENEREREGKGEEKRREEKEQGAKRLQVVSIICSCYVRCFMCASMWKRLRLQRPCRCRAVGQEHSPPSAIDADAKIKRFESNGDANSFHHLLTVPYCFFICLFVCLFFLLFLLVFFCFWTGFLAGSFAKLIPTLSLFFSPLSPFPKKETCLFHFLFLPPFSLTSLSLVLFLHSFFFLFLLFFILDRCFSPVFFFLSWGLPSAQFGRSVGPVTAATVATGPIATIAIAITVAGFSLHSALILNLYSRWLRPGRYRLHSLLHVLRARSENAPLKAATGNEEQASCASITEKDAGK